MQRIQSSEAEYILAIQDGMRLNYTHHPAKTELGRIGKSHSEDQYGLIQHSTLFVTNKNEPLGLLDVQHFHYDEWDTSRHRHERTIEEKADYCWIQALKTWRARLGRCEKKIVTVADREGDFFEFLHELTRRGESFVIRVQHDRRLKEKPQVGDGKLWDKLANAPVQGQCTATIQEVKTREIKTITLQLKALRVTLPVPHPERGEKKAKDYRPIEVNVVKASNGAYEWLLLTSLPIDTPEQIEEVVQIYRCRWHIEDYHKVLKTGYQVDEIYLHSSRQAIENLLVMACVSACRLYWLIYVGRVEPSIKAEQLFEEFEWKALYVYFKEPIPTESPSLQDVILKIARLGGYKPHKKAGPPGIKSIWIGYQQFTVAAQMYYNMLSIKT